jgi:hypothetical protein
MFNDLQGAVKLPVLTVAAITPRALSCGSSKQPYYSCLSVNKMHRVLTLPHRWSSQMYRAQQNGDRGTHSKRSLVIEGRKEMKMSVGDGWRVGIYCMVVLGAIAVGRAQTAPSKPMNEALTFNGDGAQRSKDIH